MTEKLDRDLELVKLQIAAEDCQVELQMSTTAYFATLITFVVFLMTAMVAGQIIFWFACVVIALIFILILGFTLYDRHKYRKRIRKIDAYVEDFRAGKPLPLVATLCGLKEKKRQ